LLIIGSTRNTRHSNECRCSRSWQADIFKIFAGPNFLVRAFAGAEL